MVLATAIPPESISAALADQQGFASTLASELAAGSTPGWFASLPPDVTSALPLIYSAAAPTPTETTVTSTSVSTSVSTSEVGTTAAPSSGPTGGNSTVISTVSTGTLSSTNGANSGAPTTGTSSQSTGGAAYPTAVVGAGLAGALGFLGMLAL